MQLSLKIILLFNSAFLISCSSLVLQDVTLVKTQLVDQKNAPEFVYSNTISPASISYPRPLIRVTLRTLEDARVLSKNHHSGVQVFADRCGVDPTSPVRSDQSFKYLRTNALFRKGESVTTSLDDITPNFGVLRPEDESDRYYSIFLDAKKIKFEKPYDLCLMLVGGALGSLYYSNTVRIPSALLNDAISSIPSTQ